MHQVDFSYEGFEWIDFGDYGRSIVSFIRKARDTDDFLVFAFNFTPGAALQLPHRCPKTGLLQGSARTATRASTGGATSATRAAAIRTPCSGTDAPARSTSTSRPLRDWSSSLPHKIIASAPLGSVFSRKTRLIGQDLTSYRPRRRPYHRPSNSSHFKGRPAAPPFFPIWHIS